MVKKTVLVSRAPEDCYRFWRNLENLPRIFEHIDTVIVRDSKNSHWETRVLDGQSLSWDAEIVSDIPNEMIGWRSKPGSDIDTAGSVRFERTRIGGNRGTKLRVVLKFNPPGGETGARILQWLGRTPEKEIEQDLLKFKRLMESGEPLPGDTVDEASQESFPASDPPSWTPTHA